MAKLVKRGLFQMTSVQRLSDFLKQHIRRQARGF